MVLGAMEMTLHLNNKKKSPRPAVTVFENWCKNPKDGPNKPRPSRPKAWRWTLRAVKVSIAFVGLLGGVIIPVGSGQDEGAEGSGNGNGGENQVNSGQESDEYQ